MKYARKVIFKFDIRASKYLEIFELFSQYTTSKCLSKIDIFKQCPTEIAIVAKGESLQLLIFSLYNVINIHKKVSFSLGIVILCNNEDDCRRVLSVLACMLLIPNGNHQKKVFVCRL